MGCWGMAKDRIEVKPGVNDALIKEFIMFPQKIPASVGGEMNAVC